jgi:hypothetical protein
MKENNENVKIRINYDNTESQKLCSTVRIMLIVSFFVWIFLTIFTMVSMLSFLSNLSKMFY